MITYTNNQYKDTYTTASLYSIPYQLCVQFGTEVTVLKIIEGISFNEALTQIGINGWPLIGVTGDGISMNAYFQKKGNISLEEFLKDNENIIKKYEDN